MTDARFVTMAISVCMDTTLLGKSVAILFGSRRGTQLNIDGGLGYDQINNLAYFLLISSFSFLPTNPLSILHFASGNHRGILYKYGNPV